MCIFLTVNHLFGKICYNMGMSRICSTAIKLSALLSIISLSLLTGSCYILQQGSSLIGYQIQAEKNSKLTASKDTSPEVKAFLKEVEQITAFAQEELGLEASKNYTKYVEIDRKYLAAVVSAAEELDLKQHTWSFPIVGEVPYKGFFQAEKAHREAEKLEERGLDTWISAVDAFSTLGFFKDPLYSYMIDYSPYRLANLLIHEQTHSSIWVKDHSTFNEELASFIGDEGAKLFILRRFGSTSDEYQGIFAMEADRNQFRSDMAKLRSRLEDIYSSEKSDEIKRREKAAAFSEFKSDFADAYASAYQTDAYKAVSELPINNAYVTINAVYFSQDDIYQRFLDFCDGDIRKMISLLKPLDGTRRDPKAFMEQLLTEK